MLTNTARHRHLPSLRSESQISDLKLKIEDLKYLKYEI
jgi:hypothetical protein